ncbi:MAG: family 78 glycoside hydrolase catalytic domain, partial [Bacteroidota bacterium]
MNRTSRWCLLFLCLLSTQSCFLNRGPKQHAPIQLKTNFQRQPLGLSPDGIFFSWWVSDDRPNAIQTAWQIQVGTDSAALEEGETLLWDSEQQTAGREVQIPYAGPELAPLSRYYWRVRSWDGEGETSDFSIPEPFETGPIQWQGEWIGDGGQAPDRDEEFYEDHPAPVFRKSFVLEELPTSARLHIAGLGYYEAYLNGQKSSPAVLEPGWTNFDKRILYSTYPVEDQLGVGENVLGVMLGNGWYNPLPLRLFGRWNLREILAVGQPKLLAELHLHFVDGRKEVIPTDLSWQTKPSWILRNNVYLGEKHDGRLKDPNWCEPQPPEALADWQAVQEAIPPKGTLLPQEQPPVKITQYLQPKSITEPKPGVYVVDFGQNFAGWIKLELAGEAGQQVRLRYGELVFEDGMVNGHTTMTTQIKAYTGLKGGPGAPTDAWQESHYTLGGFEGEYFQPHFSFHGFRYVQIEGYPGKLSPDRIKGLRLSAALKGAGSFVSGNEAFNQIQDATLWTFLSNVFSVQSDCPAREKFGYGGDMVTASEAFVFNFDMANFYRKTVQDFADDARPLGGMPECAPNNDIASEGLGDGSGPIGWQLAYPFLQEVLYRFYGDHQLIEEQYPTVQPRQHLGLAVLAQPLLLHVVV